MCGLELAHVDLPFATKDNSEHPTATLSIVTKTGDQPLRRVASCRWNQHVALP